MEGKGGEGVRSVTGQLKVRTGKSPDEGARDAVIDVLGNG